MAQIQLERAEFMDGIDLMVEEHKNIKRMLTVIRRACLNVMNGEALNYTDFENIIDFVRNYADRHHHGKEEQFLFNKMIEAGGAAEKLVRHGMLVEHDLGRLHIKELEEAIVKVRSGDNEAKLDVIANAIGYANLLNRHIDKEDEVAYKFARRVLNEETLDKVNTECETYEDEMKSNGVQDRYIKLLKSMEEKYI
jgi:hemerythrin-like domain-containing protein